MKFGSLIVATVLLAGCTSQQLQSVPLVEQPASAALVQQPQSAAPVLSDSPKGQIKDRDRDLYECQREATFAGIGAKQQVFDNCMKARGYTPSNKAWYQR
jgi:hypothetical protein